MLAVGQHMFAETYFSACTGGTLVGGVIDEIQHVPQCPVSSVCITMFGKNCSEIGMLLWLMYLQMFNTRVTLKKYTPLLALRPFDEKSRPIPVAFSSFVREVADIWYRPIYNVERDPKLDGVVVVFVRCGEQIRQKKRASHGILLSMRSRLRIEDV